MAEAIGRTDREAGDGGGQWNAREIARRNLEQAGRALSPVMKTAATACELAHSPAARGGRR